MISLNTDVQTTLERHLRSQRDAGRKLLVPYVTGGLGSQWVELIEAIAAAGADAIEVALPFSDPSIDGPTIQEASMRALQNGATPHSVLDALANREIGVPIIAMTYYNVAFRAGHHRFANLLAASGIRGAILPDLPPHLAGDWIREADQTDVANVLMVAPISSDERIAEVAHQSRGFVYAVSIMGTTGERAELADSALELGQRTKAITDKPVLVGFGLSTPDQVVEAAGAADGAIVASALIRRILDGATIDDAVDLIREMRLALDHRWPPQP